jgi:hypothetical protein
MKIFISGAIGKYLGSEEGEAFVINRFGAVEQFLKTRNPDCEVFNPISLTKTLGWNATHEEYMKECIKELKTSDICYFMYDWYTSKGSRMEFELAEQLGLRVIMETSNLTPNFQA